MLWKKRERQEQAMTRQDSNDAPSEIRRQADIAEPRLTRDHVVWAYRVLLDRDPENEDVIGPKLAGSKTTRELRHHLMKSAGVQEKNRDYAHANDRTLVIKEIDTPRGAYRLYVDLSDHVIGLNIVRGRYET